MGGFPPLFLETSTSNCWTMEGKAFFGSPAPSCSPTLALLGHLHSAHHVQPHVTPEKWGDSDVHPQLTRLRFQSQLCRKSWKQCDSQRLQKNNWKRMWLLFTCHQNTFSQATAAMMASLRSKNHRSVRCYQNEAPVHILHHCGRPWKKRSWNRLVDPIHLGSFRCLFLSPVSFYSPSPPLAHEQGIRSDGGFLSLAQISPGVAWNNCSKLGLAVWNHWFGHV